MYVDIKIYTYVFFSLPIHYVKLKGGGGVSASVTTHTYTLSIHQYGIMCYGGRGGGGGGGRAGTRIVVPI